MFTYIIRDGRALVKAAFLLVLTVKADIIWLRCVIAYLQLRHAMCAQASELQFRSHNEQIDRYVMILVIADPTRSCLVPVSALASPALQEARVIAVNDGDTVTIRMNGKDIPVHGLIGIDAPETGQEPWGKRSREHLRKILKDLHWNVLIETDVQPYDKYNRLLVYLWDDNNEADQRTDAPGRICSAVHDPAEQQICGQVQKGPADGPRKKLGIWGPDGLKERPLDYKKKHPRSRNLVIPPILIMEFL